MDMKLDRTGSEMVYTGDEGTVSRYHLKIAKPDANGAWAGTWVEFDALVDAKDPDLTIVVVPAGESTGGIVTGGRAAMVFEGLGSTRFEVDGHVLTIPDAINMHVDSGSVISYLGQRIGRFASQLGLL
jgi:hypothetical protein